MSEPVALLDLQAQYRPLRQELLDAVTRVCDSQRFIGGPKSTASSASSPTTLEVPHAIGLSSGTDALLAALMALDIGPGDEVITPTYSFFATAGCVARVGATPVLVDSDPAPSTSTRRRSSPRSPRARKAIMPVHLFGQAADMAPLAGRWPRARHRRSSRTPRRPSAARITARPVGTLGAIGCFSFFPSKNLGAFGDAGLVTTDRRALAHEVRLIRTHGMEPQVLPPADRRQLPHRRHPGRGAAREAAAPRRLDRGAPRQRRPLSRAVCRRRPERSRGCRSRRRSARTSTTSS